jgi:hypothetical protein
MNNWKELGLGHGQYEEPDNPRKTTKPSLRIASIQS